MRSFLRLVAVLSALLSSCASQDRIALLYRAADSGIPAKDRREVVLDIGSLALDAVCPFCLNRNEVPDAFDRRHPMVQAALACLLADRDPLIARVGAACLSAWGDRTAPRKLLKRLEDTDDIPLRSALVHALQRLIGDPLIEGADLSSKTLTYQNLETARDVTCPEYANLKAWIEANEDILYWSAKERRFVVSTSAKAQGMAIDQWTGKPDPKNSH